MIPDFPHNIRIRLTLLIFLLHPDVVKSLPCWLSQSRKAKLRQPTGQRQGQSYSYIMRKVWYHQIWIQNYLGFIVLILTFMQYFILIPNISKISCKLYGNFFLLFQHILTKFKVPVWGFYYTEKQIICENI